MRKQSRNNGLNKWACRVLDGHLGNLKDIALSPKNKFIHLSELFSYLNLLKSHSLAPSFFPLEYKLEETYNERREVYLEKESNFSFSSLLDYNYSREENFSVLKSRLIDVFEHAQPLVVKNREQTPIKNNFGIGYADLDLVFGHDEDGELVYCCNVFDDFTVPLRLAILQRFLERTKVKPLDMLCSEDTSHFIRDTYREFLLTPDYYKMFEVHNMRFEHDSSVVSQVNREPEEFTSDVLADFITDRYIGTKIQKEIIKNLYG